MRPIFRTLFIIAALLAAMSPALARADVLHYVEDFSDDAGNPASDPMFNHSCMIDDPEGTKWDITSYLLGKNAMILYVFSNTITFNIPSDHYVQRAEVESRTYRNSVTFFGTLGEVSFVADEWPYTRPSVWSATSAEIGPITAVRLTAGQGWFDNIAIDVAPIPEPGTLALFLPAALALLLAGCHAQTSRERRMGMSWVRVISRTFPLGPVKQQVGQSD